MYNRFLLYGHGGAYNHGAEAIVKCTADLIKSAYTNSRIVLSTHFKEQDLQFDMPVDEYCERDSEYVLLEKASVQKGIYDKLIYKSTIDNITRDTVCLSIGGDNYCYDNWHKWKTIHEKAIESGTKSILWSCSIEPAMMTDAMIDTLKSHHMITARESITYNALKERGLSNVILCSDVAFLLKEKEVILPENFIEGNTVAINISPLVVRRQITNGIIIENIKTLIEHIIYNSDMNIALIPHVVMPMDNDYLLLQDIYKSVGHKERICLIPDNLSAAEYKYIISKCRFGVLARTHATIAAYSSGIPTIAIGYSVKARGIALDLDLEDYVLPLESISDELILSDMFERLMGNETWLKKIIKSKISDCKEKAKRNLSAIYPED